MSTADTLAACLVMTIWGLNFLVIKLGVADLPPLLLGALRFVFVAFPAILLVPRPQVPFGRLAAYALTVSFGQFAFLFSAIGAGMPAGLASLVLQVQAFIAPVIAALVLGERLLPKTIVGLSIAFSGLVVLVVASDGSSTMSLAGFVLTLGAAASWAVGNILGKQFAATNFLGIVVWSALIPIPAFLIASALVDGLPAMGQALTRIGPETIAVLAYLAWAASLVGYGIWTRLVSRYPVQLVTPLTLSIPIIGISAAWLLLGEVLTGLQAAGCLVIIIGLLINVFGDRWSAR